MGWLWMSLLLVVAGCTSSNTNDSSDMKTDSNDSYEAMRIMNKLYEICGDPYRIVSGELIRLDQFTRLHECFLATVEAVE